MDRNDEHGRATRIFLNARELTPASRLEYLEAACGGDLGLRREVESLLTHDLEAAAGAGTADPPPAGPDSGFGIAASRTTEYQNDGAETPPRVGPYRILQKLGEGGMGEVFLAERVEPVRQRVALKLIKHGMDSKRVVARFEAERQALALMDHACVAKVFDAGTTLEGRPYFVMEYVQGIPITEHCDRQRLITRERLELFIRVCEGVQHAHQRAIIHRDLKPTNVLVAVEDGRPVPKIIDFGVAKAIAQRLTEKTLFTELGMLVGTPEYMSPEQADATAQEVDTRTDVYSLGVMLYELMVGVLPLETKVLRDEGYDELRRKIREVEPARPSARLKTLDEAVSTETARRRCVDVPALRRLLTGDLDWITMKSLEKDRERRYGSPAEMAEDIRRHLRHEPVLAGPPSMRYRARKFLRRHAIAVGVAAGVWILVLAFGVAMYAQAQRIAAEKVRADESTQAAKRVSTFLVDLFELSDPVESKGATGGQITARQLLDLATKRIRSELRDEPRHRAELLGTLGKVYTNLYLYDAARPVLEEALEIRLRESGEDHLDTAQAQFDLAKAVLFRDRGRARTLMSSALDIRQRLLGPNDPETAKSLYGLAVAEFAFGNAQEVSSLLQRALGIQQERLSPDHEDIALTLNSMGHLARREGQLDQAREVYERVIAIRERSLGSEHPQVADALNNLALTLADLGRYDEAEAAQQRSAAIFRQTLGANHPRVARAISAVGEVQRVRGELAAAAESQRQAIVMLETDDGSTHPSQLAGAYNNLAIVLHEQHLDKEAEQCFRRAIAIKERIEGEEPDYVVTSVIGLGAALQAQKKYAEAEAAYRRGIEIAERYRGPEDRKVGTGLLQLGTLFHEQGKLIEARGSLERAVSIREKRFGPDNLSTALALESLAEVIGDLGDVQRAEKLFQRVLRIQRAKLRPDHPDITKTLAAEAKMMRRAR